MNFAQLLDYGPRLPAGYFGVEIEPQKPSRKYSSLMIERYKSYSINGRIWSNIIASKEAISVANAAKNLRRMANDGLLLEDGRLKESKSSCKPYIFKWVENA